MNTAPPYLMHLNDHPAPLMVRGAGSWLYDETGRAYLDFIQGWAVNALGHCPPEVVNALSAQAQQLLTPSPALRNQPREELARLLCEHTGLDKAYFCNSGAEANDCATKLARKWGRLHRDGAYEVITTLGGFHGRTLAMTAASGKPGWDAIAPPNLPGFVKVPFGDLAAMYDAIGERTCAVLLEPIQGEAGVIVPPRDYLREVRRLTRQHGVLLVLDEIQTGCGRTGSLLHSQLHGVLPDVVTLGKGLGGGVPIGAVLATEHAACFALGDHGGTFGGNPLACAAAVALLSTITQPGFFETVMARGELLAAGLRKLEADSGVIAELRGAGLLWGLKLKQPLARQVATHCFEAGLIINATRDDTLRLMPQLRVTESEIELVLKRLKEALSCAGLLARRGIAVRPARLH